ncbi:M55 family metallopeptidase [Arthrobacter sp. 35W]|uniref:M55 family metallopeptidase n=1 Tax=Arthrobacter sp. 35W TaxID=1132441 RepID=UPI0018CB09EB
MSVKTFISIDMEGVAGVATFDQVAGGYGYPRAQELMTLEVNAAIAGAFDGVRMRLSSTIRTARWTTSARVRLLIRLRSNSASAPNTGCADAAGVGKVVGACSSRLPPYQVPSAASRIPALTRELSLTSLAQRRQSAQLALSNGNQRSRGRRNGAVRPIFASRHPKTQVTVGSLARPVSPANIVGEVPAAETKSKVIGGEEVCPLMACQCGPPAASMGGLTGGELWAACRPCVDVQNRVQFGARQDCVFADGISSALVLDRCRHGEEWVLPRRRLSVRLPVRRSLPVHEDRGALLHESAHTFRLVACGK